jgi:hypothetical protein
MTVVLMTLFSYDECIKVGRLVEYGFGGSLGV